MTRSHYPTSPGVTLRKPALACLDRRRSARPGAREGVNEMAKNSKQTSKAVARKASAALRDGRSSGRTKSIAGSALAQTKPTKR